MGRKTKIAAAGLLLGGIAACAPVPAGETRPAHGGSGAEHAHADGLDPVGVTVWTGKLLLYLEHPPLVRGERARFLAHLSLLATGEPVRAGRATLEVDAAGAPRAFVAAAPARDGLFVPEGSLEEAGRFAARLVVEAGESSETIDLGDLEVHPSAEAARAAASASEDLSGTVPFLLEQQWKIGLLLVPAARRTLVERLELPAQVLVPQPAAAAVVPPAAGRLLAPESGALPAIGARVRAGEVLGFVEPPLAAGDLAGLRSLELQRQSLELELDLKVLEVTRAIREAEARLAFVLKESERVATLRAEGLGTVRELAQAEQDVLVARADAEAARAMRESLDRLLASRAGATKDSGTVPVRFPLLAPIGGVVVDASRAVGESVDVTDRLFRVVDPARIWIEGRISEFDLARVPDEPAASLVLAAFPDLVVDIREVGGRMLQLGYEVDPASRTLAIRYEMPNPDGRARPGMLATLHVATREAHEAVAIPAEAVIVDQGLPTAYVMLEGELFQRRELELGVRDSGWVEVRRGLAPGERVATRGAWSVRLAGFSPASFGAGHAH